MKKIIVDKKYNGNTVISVIQKIFPNMSKNSIYKVFRVRDIKLNDIRVKQDFIVKTGDTISIYAPDNVILGIPSSIKYAYEDDNVIVAHKPAGIVSCYEEQDKGQYEQGMNILSFEQMVQSDKNMEGIKICHRLDTGTEGLVIFSKNETAHTELLKGFKQGKINKEYIAVVYGKPPKKHDTLSHYIVKDAKTSYSKISEKKVSGALECITEYDLLKYDEKKNISTVRIKLHTGRTHQIRVHMKYIGCPVVGDSRYGINEINRKLKVSSQLLFACSYSFNFDNTSPLNYLNSVRIEIHDISGKCSELYNNVELKLAEAYKELKETNVRYSHKQVFSEAKKIVKGTKGNI